MSFVVQSAARFFPLFFPLLAASTFVCFAKVGALVNASLRSGFSGSASLGSAA